MAVTDIDSKLNLIEKFAEEQGAHAAATFPSDAVVLDSRVKMKCEMPICPHFG